MIAKKLFRLPFCVISHDQCLEQEHVDLYVRVQLAVPSPGVVWRPCLPLQRALAPGFLRWPQTPAPRPGSTISAAILAADSERLIARTTLFLIQSCWDFLGLRLCVPLFCLIYAASAFRGLSLFSVACCCVWLTCLFLCPPCGN